MTEMNTADWRVGMLGENAATESPEMFKYFERFKEPAEAIKSAYEVHKLNTRKTEDIKAEVAKQHIPQDDWNDEQWNNYIKARQVDKSLYKVPQVPDEYKELYKPERVQAIIDKAHASGIHPKFVNAMLADEINSRVEDIKALQAEAAKIKVEDEKALKEELAKAGKDYNEFTEMAKRGRAFAAKQTGLTELEGLLAKYGMDTHPAFQKIFNFIGVLSSDPKFVSGSPDDGKTAKTQYELNKERWPNTPSMWGDPNK